MTSAKVVIAPEGVAVIHSSLPGPHSFAHLGILDTRLVKFHEIATNVTIEYEKKNGEPLQSSHTYIILRDDFAGE